MKISKTLKRLRNEKGITQEQLAEKLFISRQSVSSWENDRTQPDIEMLGKLSEIFEVSVEELVYGKKRNTSLETKKTNYSFTLIVVFSVLGALLVGIGLILIFVTFWQKMPLFFKGFLSFLPLIAGQASGLFVLIKKRDKISWCEGSAVLWTAGIAATLTMLHNIFALNLYWYNTVFIAGVLILPVIFLLKAVSPIIIYYGCILTGGYVSLIDGKLYILILFTAILICVGLFYSYFLLKKEKKSHRSIYSNWISILALFVFMTLTAFILEEAFILCVLTLGTFGIGLLLLSFKDNDISMPYKLPGLIFTSLMLTLCSAVSAEAIGETYDFYTHTEYYIFSAICIIALVLCLLFVRKTEKDKFMLSYIAVGTFALMVFLISAYISPEYSLNSDAATVNFLKAVAFAANILLMISGSRERKLIPINIGFISVAVISILVVYQSGLSLMGAGVLLLAFGVALLIINFRISKLNQKKCKEFTEEGVQDDE